jgi:hypothetical protein
LLSIGIASDTLIAMHTPSWNIKRKNLQCLYNDLACICIADIVIHRRYT